MKIQIVQGKGKILTQVCVQNEGRVVKNVYDAFVAALFCLFLQYAGTSLFLSDLVQICIDQIKSMNASNKSDLYEDFGIR